MTDAPKNFKKLAAGALAIVLTLGAAGAAVAVNLASADSGQSSPAGQLTAVRDTTVAPGPDVTVPSSGAASVAGPSTAAQRVDDDHSEDRDDHGDHDDDDHDDDHDEGRDEVERGHDDDD